MKSYSQFLIENTNNSISSLSSELLYTIILDEDNSDDIISEALYELYMRDELSEEILNELNGVAGEPPLIKSPLQLTGPKSSAVSPSSSSSIKDVAGKTLRSTPKALPSPSSVASSASRLSPQAAALGVGLGAGYAAKKALNTVGPGANSKTNNISKANKSPSNTGLSFKGDLPTMPKTTDNTKSIPLTGKTFDPIKTALRGTDSQPQVNKRMIGPMPGTKADSQKQVLAKSSPTNTVTRSAKPVDTSAKSSPRPVTSKSTNPIIPKTVPKANNTVDKGYMNDLRGSAARMKSATSDLTKSTGKTVSALNKIAPSGRMERPTSKGGMTSSQIHSGISKLGGEPTRSAPKAVPKVSKPASPPTLSASALKKNPSSGGGKWI